MEFPNVGGTSGGAVLSKEVFIKLEDKEKVQGVFRGNPKIFKTHWNGKFGELCPESAGLGTCARCSNDEKSKFRFRINFITRQDGKWIAKVFENSYGTYQDIKALHEGEYNLEETCVTISRTGKGLNDTRYQVMPSKGNGGLTPDDFRAFLGIKLHDLSVDGKAPTPSSSAEGDVPSSWNEPGASG